MGSDCACDVYPWASKYLLRRDWGGCQEGPVIPYLRRYDEVGVGYDLTQQLVGSIDTTAMGSMFQ